MAGAPATSEWRRAENVWYPLDIRELDVPPPSAPSTSLAAPSQASMGLGQDVSLEEKADKDQGKRVG